MSSFATIKWFGFRKLYWIILRVAESVKNLLIDYEIISPKSHQTLVKFDISKRLIRDYHGDVGHNLNFQQYFLGFGLLHYAFIRNIKPKRILCVGSKAGFIPAIIALACKDNKYGGLHFVDAGYDLSEHSKHWSGIGFWRKVDPDKHFAQIGVNKYISTYVMTTREYAKKFQDRKYQYIYIDGDHSYEGVKEDYNLFWPRLDKYGFMIFHDVVARGYLDQGKFGVWKLWREISKKNALVFSFPKDSGLGIIQKL